MPEQPQGPHRRPRRACRTRRSWPARPRPRRSCASGSTPTPSKQDAYGDAWDKIAEAQKVAARDRPAATTSLERGLGLRHAALRDRPDARPPGRGERPSPTPSGCASTATSDLESLELAALLRRARSTPSCETAKLADSLRLLDEAAWRRRPAGRAECSPARSPRAGGRRAGRRARKLADVAVRKKLAEGGKAAIDASRRPDDRARPGRRRRRPRGPQERSRTQVEEPQRQAVRQDRQGRASPIEGDGDLPRRDLHAAAGLRHGQGLRGGRQEGRRLRRRSAALYEHAEEHGNKRPVRAAASAGSRRKEQARPRRRRSTSSARPTSSAATPAARSSTATARSSASSSTATSSRSCSTSPTTTAWPAPSRSTRAGSSRPCGRSTAPRPWSRS